MIDSKVPDWLWNVRVCNWPAHGKGNEGCRKNLQITSQEARKIAKGLKEKGINFVNASFSFHFRFNFVDIFDEIREMTKIIVDACHEYGIRVYEHHSSTAVTKTGIRYKSWNIDDWTNVDVRTGNATIFGTYGRGTHWLCINNPDFKAAYFEYITDFIEYTGVDGLMHDDIQFAPGWFHCGCKHCRKKFKTIFGYELPVGKNSSVWEDFNSTVWRDWIRFRIFSTGDELVDISKVIGKDKALFSCCSIGSTSTLEAHDAGYTYESFARGANVLFLETILISRNIPYAERKYYYNWTRLVLEKKYYSGMSYHLNMPVIDLHYPSNAEEDFFCWALTKSFGHNMWRDEAGIYGGSRYKLFTGKPCYDYFNWEASNEKLYRYPKSYANIAILFSANTKILLGENADYYVNEWMGWCQTLIEENIPFEVILDDTLCDITNLKGYRLLILPNAACLSTKQVQTIEKFVKNGGHLILSHETSLYDEAGKKLKNFGLSDLIGLSYKETIDGINVPFFIDPQKEGVSLVNGLKGRFPYYAPQVLVKPKSGKNLIYYAWVERYNVYACETDYPAIVERKDSNPRKGKVLYFSPKVGLMNHIEGVYSYGGVNYAGEKVNVKENSRQKKAYWTFHRPSVPEQQRVFWLNERMPDYKSLILNSIHYLIGKNANFKTHNVPEGVFINLYRLGKNSTDNGRDNGDIVIHIVNAIGAKLSSGNPIPKIPNVVYPRVADCLPKDKKMTLELLADGVRESYLVSPDFTGRKKLRTIRRGKICIIEIPPSLVDRYSVIHLVRGTN